MKLDFFARRAHYIDHLAPVWNALPSEHRGAFHVTQELELYARAELQEPNLEIFDDRTPSGDNPILVASYGDIARAARKPARKIIHMEHGTGHAFGKAPYPNGVKGKRDLVSLFLAPNEYTARLIRSVRSTRVEVIGTPKMDAVLPAKFPARLFAGDPLIAIAFHWGERNASPPESGTAWEHYREILPEVAKRYQVIGHGHPLAAPSYRREFERAGVEWVANFRDVLASADLYINDLSSTMYEFMVTGKPVIVLNAPWFRRNVSWGIRFWDYSNVGINVDDPAQLFAAIDRTIAEYETICLDERRSAVTELYPYRGRSAQRSVEVITAYLQELEGS